MQVTNGDVWTARDSLKALLGEKLPVKTAYWLSRLARELGTHLVVIEEIRNKLITQYGQANENGQISIDGTSPNWPTFVAAHNELMDEPTEISCLSRKITLQASNGLCIKSADLLLLDPFLEVSIEDESP